MEVAFSLTVLALPLVARLLSERAQRHARQRLWRAHDPRPSSDAMRGHKVAQLIVGDDGAWLAGVTSLRYGVDGLAHCRRRDCRPPGLDCRCGFYAFRDRRDAVALLRRLTSQHPARSYALLTVDLDGEVLEYEQGYRAQRQRVLAVEVAGGCVRGARSATPHPASGWVAHPSFRGEQLLYERTLMARTALPVGSAPVRSLCDAHTPVGAGDRRLDLVGLRGLLGTDVSVLARHDDPTV